MIADVLLHHELLLLARDDEVPLGVDSLGHRLDEAIASDPVVCVVHRI